MIVGFGLFIVNTFIFCHTGHVVSLLGMIICGLCAVVSGAIICTEETNLPPKAKAAVATVLPKRQQLVCSYCGKHQVSGREDCPNC
ncbi:MAG: hypothetical protein AAB568_01265, partial [Patescibacteria group bacterium]